MKLYVAGKWQEKSQVRKVQDYLKDRGHEITYDWTQHEMTVDPEEGGDIIEIYGQHYSRTELGEQSVGDANGVNEADVVVIVAINNHRYAGAFTEMGISIGHGRPVYVIGHGMDYNIFIYHPLVQVFESMEDLPL